MSMRLMPTKDWDEFGDFRGWTFYGNIDGKYVEAYFIVDRARTVINKKDYEALVKEYGGTVFQSIPCRFPTKDMAIKFLEALEPYLLAAKLRERAG